MEQAIYGAVGNGHALIAASPGNEALAARFTGRTDLPNTAPAGVDWAPFDSLLIDHQHLVLMRTWPDTSAARGGMVITHALFAPWAQAMDQGNLLSLLDALPKSPSRSINLEPIEVTDASDRREVPSHSTALMQALLSEPESSGPIVWLEETGLSECIATLWGRLPPSLRFMLTFRMSFGPEDIPSTQPKFVSTPRSLKARWHGKQVVDPSSPPPLASDTALALVDEGKAARIRDYAAAFGVEVTSLRNISLLVQSWSLSNGENRTVASLVDEIRLLLHLSPTNGVGLEAKKQLVDKLARLLASAGMQEVLSMRNLSIDQWFAEHDVWKSLADWCARAAQLDEDDNAIWQSAYAATANTNWTNSVLRGLADGLGSGSPNWSVWWRRWTNAPDLIEPTFEILRRRSDAQDHISSSCPNSFDASLASIVLTASAHNHWWRLHARVARRSRTTREAFAVHISADRQTNNFDGLRELIAGLTPSELVAQAIEHPDPRLCSLAGELAATSPETLAAFDARKEAWRQVWCAAQKVNADVWRALGDINEVRTSVGRAITEDSQVGGQFLLHIAQTPIGDFHQLADRAAIWDKVVEPARTQLLRATARGWLDSFSRGEFSSEPLEPPLAQQITSRQEKDWYLQGCGSSPIAALRYFEQFSNIPESDCVEWLSRVGHSQSLSRPDAERLGELARSRRWRHLSSRIASSVLYHGRSDLAPALALVRSQLSLTEQSLLFIRGFVNTQPTAGELWSIIEDVAADLYGDGPKDSEIWSRSGGNNAELPSANNGRGKWHALIDQLRRQGASISAARLIATMRSDHPNNEHLRWLEGWTIFGGDSE